MKFLALLFFVGLTLTSARRIPSQNLDYNLDSDDELDLFDQSEVQNEEQRTGSEVAERLNEILDRLLERFINLIDEKPDTVNEGLETFVERVRELRQILRETKEELGVRSRPILERIREKLLEVRDNLRRRLREIFGGDSGSAYAEVIPVELDTAAEVAQRLREILDRVLYRIIRYLEDRKVSAEDSLETLVERIKEIGQIVNQRREELGSRGRQILERIRERVQELRQILGRNLQEIFGIRSQSVGEYARNVQTEDDDTSSEVVERLRDILDRVLERFINLIDEKRVTAGDGLETFIERVRELRKILRERRELGVRGQQILDRIRERLQLLRDRLSRRLQEIFGDSSREGTSLEIAQRFREVLDNLLDRLIRYLDDSKVSTEDNLETAVEKVKEIGQILRQRREELGVRGREILERIRERLQKLREKLGRKLREIFGIDSQPVSKYEEDVQIEEEGSGSEAVERLREILDRVLERFVNFIDEKRVTADDDLETFVKRVNELRQLLRERREELGSRDKQILERIRQRLQELRERLRRRLREIFGNGSRSAFSDVIPAEDDTASDVVQRLREVLERVLDKIIRYLDGRKVSANDNLESVVKRIEEIGQLLRQKKGELGVRGRQILERIRDRIQDLRQKLERILREIFENDSNTLYAEGFPEEETDDSSELVQRLRETLNKIVENIRKFIDEGKVTADDVFEKLAERVRRIRQQLKDENEELRGKGREVLDNVRSRLRELRERWEKKLKEIFGFGSRPDGMYTEGVQADSRDENESLRDKFDEIVRRIKDALESGRSIKEALEALRELRQKLREKKSEFQGRIFEIFERLREKVREYLRKIFDNNEAAKKRNVSIREYLRKLTEMVVDQIDIDEVENKLEEFFGKRSEISERILNVLREKSGNVRQRVLTVIDTLLGENEEKRSLNDTYENIRDFFEGLAIRIKERYLKFGEWAKPKYDEGLERGRDKVERIRILAREYLNDLIVIGKDVREQGYEFFREYKEDLKNIWEDIQNKIQEIRSRE